KHVRPTTYGMCADLRASIHPSGTTAGAIYTSTPANTPRRGRWNPSATTASGTVDEIAEWASLPVSHAAAGNRRSHRSVEGGAQRRLSHDARSRRCGRLHPPPDRARRLTCAIGEDGRGGFPPARPWELSCLVAWNGQVTAERWKTRTAAAVMRIAQAARTSRLMLASALVLAIPQMSCRPAPVRSSTP